VSVHASESQQSLPTRAPRGDRSPRSREAHDRGTRASRRTLVGIVVVCVLLAAGRPVYGPYIDRFGETGDKSVIVVVKSTLQKRAEKHDLTALPRSWGHRRNGERGGGEVIGKPVSHETFSLRRAYESLSQTTVEERERVIRTLWDELVAPGKEKAFDGETADAEKNVSENKNYEPPSAAAR